jgi:drug/metabolite transporter (DMT)-like permease
MWNSRSLQALAELLLATALWGFGFVASVWALQKVDAFELTLLRLVIASLIGLPFALSRSARAVALEYLRLAWLPAALLAGTLIFQTWGLQYTTPTKSGFITTLYVVFVPILDSVVQKRLLPRMLWFCVFLALLGTALIVNLGIGEINFGDVLTFVCSIIATFQIYWMGQVSRVVRRPFLFNVYQFFWALPLVLPWVHLKPFYHKLLEAPHWPAQVQIGILSLALGSTMVAFFLQVRAQAKLSATVSSLMFLLESPFALLFSMLFLQQGLSTLEGLGGGLIFVSALMATWFEGRAKKIAFPNELGNS